jgi:hypothetical protein
MSKKIVLIGRGLTGGIAEGTAIVTKQPFNLPRALSFQMMIGRRSSIVMDEKHELFGKDIREKILVIPHNIGACTAGATLLQAIRSGVAPKAIVGIEIEPMIVEGAIFAENFYDLKFPIVDRCDKNPLTTINTGDHVRVDGDKGLIEVIKKNK